MLSVDSLLFFILCLHCLSTEFCLSTGAMQYEHVLESLLVEPWMPGRHWGRWSEGELKAGGLVLETRWFCLLLEVSDCCEGSVIGKMAQVG